MLRTLVSRASRSIFSRSEASTQTVGVRSKRLGSFIFKFITLYVGVINSELSDFNGANNCL